MIRALVAGALPIVAALAAAAPAAACRAGEVDLPSHHRHGRGPAPWVIGDSTSIFAAPVLARYGIAADAHGCRQFDQGVAMLARRGAGNPDAVVLALGANGAVSAGQIARARRVLGSRRFLLLVTPKNSSSTRAAMLAAARRYPDRVLALDWAAYSASHGGWFGGDNLHVNYAGARAYARFIRDGLTPFLARGFAVVGLRKAAACGHIRAYGRRIRVFVLRAPEGVGCALARLRMRAPRLHPPVRWRYYDWRRVRRGPWTDVLARRDRSIVLAGIAA